MQRWHQVGIRVRRLGDPSHPDRAVQIGVAPLVDVELADASALMALGMGEAKALVFVVAGLLGVLTTIAAFNSRNYRELSAAYAAHTPAGAIKA